MLHFVVWWYLCWSFSCCWFWELMKSSGFIPRVKLFSGSSQPADVSSLICLLFVKWGDAAAVNASVTVQLKFHLASHLSHQLADPETLQLSTHHHPKARCLFLKSTVITRRRHTSSIIQTGWEFDSIKEENSQEVRSVWAEWQQKAAESVTQRGRRKLECSVAATGDKLKSSLWAAVAEW